jgi:hypothetical protein
MIRQNQHQAPAPSTSDLFARKGEAVPVGGRRAPRRIITMRPLMAEHDAPVTPPQPANTSAPAPREHRGMAAPSNVVPFAAPTMGPAASAATLHVSAPAGAKRADRDPVRQTAAKTRKRSATRRTTLRLDDTMRDRLARFSDSETLSVQALLTRALERHLPAISVERSTAASLRLPHEAHKSTPAGRRSVRFDRHLYWRLKSAATKRRRSMQSIMTAALDAYLCELETVGETRPRPTHLSVVA